MLSMRRHRLHSALPSSAKEDLHAFALCSAFRCPRRRLLRAPLHRSLRADARRPPPPPAPDYTLTANVGLFSQYSFRGIAQTAGKPAVQGGFDWAHSSGFYLGTWGSNISWLEDFGAYTRSSLEWDFYGGYKNNFPGSEDWSYDVGTLYYYYPGSRNPGFANANTWEIYGALNWKWLGAKFSYSLDNYFGAKPDRQEDGRHVVRRPLRQLSGRGIRVHDPRALRDSSTSTTTEAAAARPRTTTGGWALRTRCRTVR